MPIELSVLTRDIDPERTVLMFGAGSSIPSGAPSVARLQEHFAKIFNVSSDGYTLAEQTGIIENRTRDRARLILELRSQFKAVRPAGALLNLPLCKWKSIYTTNYDELVEACYKRHEQEIDVYTCNFDFHIRRNPDSIQLFKLHGTIQKDEAFGDKSRLILTQADYDNTENFREDLYTRLQGDLVGAHLIVIGHSLADPDIRAIVDRVLRLRAASGSATKVTLFLYTPDEGRAELFEARGLDVCFGGIDDFFAGMVKHVVAPTVNIATGDPLDVVHALRTSTVDIAHALGLKPDVSGMYNGWPVSYADIRAGQTFQRNVAKTIEREILEGTKSIVVLLGASGVGKTSAVRQALAEISREQFAWEHRGERPFIADNWLEVANLLKKDGKAGVLMIDEAHNALPEINNLIEDLDHENNESLQLILISTNHQWHLRTKASVFYRNSVTHLLSSIEKNEIDRLISLIESSSTIRALTEHTFAGFSFQEKRRRLIQKCSADMFVCLKNIFSSDKLDDIILREYAELDPASQDVYRSVAAMESAGVHVHRQLVIRLLGIRAMDIDATLSRLRDIIHETTVSEREGIYAWRGRHKIIMDVIANHKFFDSKKRYDLFSDIIDSISPTYDIEIRTIRDLCNLETGLPAIMDKDQQNLLLRKMISAAPAERVPRHRLLRNLIEANKFDPAETELRIFQNDFGLDGPAVRYKILLATARAVRAPGLMDEDRVALLEKAREIASAAASRHKMNRGILIAYCEVGLEIAKLTGRAEVFEAAIHELKIAEDQIGDPTISVAIARLSRRMSNINTEPLDLSDILLEEDL